MRRRVKQGSGSGRLAGLAVGVLGVVLVGVQPLEAQQILVGPPVASSVAPGDLVEIPILVDMSNAGGVNIASLQFEVSWDAAHLQYMASDQSGLPGGWTGIPNETNVGAGTFAWAGFSPTGTTGPFVAVTLVFQGIAPDGTTTAICVTVTAAGDEIGTSLLPVIPTPRCGGICVGVSGLWGDVNDDGQVNIIDAQQIARYSVGLPPPPDPYLIAEFCDVTQDGVCNIIDAQQVARYAIGLSVCPTCIPGDVKAGCPPPEESQDVVVINDMNAFTNQLGWDCMADPNNQQLVRNLVNFTGQGPRASGTVVVFDRGRNSSCYGNGECNDANLNIMRQVILSEGMAIVDIFSTSGSITSPPPIDAKVVFLWNPRVPFTAVEVGVFRQFASEGGRIVFVGEHEFFYGAEGIATENQFLLDMGAQLTNTGGYVDCDQIWVLPATSLRPHQVTGGLTGLSFACASVINPGPQDYPLFYDMSNTLLLGGVARVDVAPFSLAFLRSDAERQEDFERDVRRLEGRIRVWLSEHPELVSSGGSGLRP